MKSIVLPFSGFYENPIMESIDYLFEEGDPDNYDPKLYEKIDWTKAQFNLAKVYTEGFTDQLNALLDDLDIKGQIHLEFDEMLSPKFYNFETDRIFARITDRSIEILYENTNEASLRDMIRKTFTSYDGFSSFYPNDRDEWPESPLFWDHNQLSTLLEAFLMQETEGSYEFEQSVWEDRHEDIEEAIMSTLPEVMN